jgi:hypothetical protein
MKKILTIIVALLAGGLLVYSCGYGGQGLDGGTDGGDGNECTQAAEIQMQGFDQACSQLSNVCCFCQCWFDSRKMYDSEQYFTNEICVCNPLQINPVPCEGTALTAAQECLANPTTCRAEAVDMVTNAQEGMCTLTPL